MTKYYDIDGQEIPDVMSKEDVDKKIVEEKSKLETEYKTKLEESTSKLSVLETDLAKAKEDLKTANPKGDDFKAMRDIVKTLEGKVEEANKANETMKTELKSGRVGNLVSKFSGGDVELEKKIRFNMENSLAGMKTDTDEDLAKKVSAAYKLSTGEDTPNPMRKAMGGGSFSPLSNNGKPVEFNQREKDLGNKLGISDKDREKYGKDPRINN